MERRGRIWIGTSGWHYDHWVGPVYEPGLDSRGRLAHYTRSLDSVEINSTFYGLPAATTVQSWHDTTPPDFLFAVKASRYITHMKKLKDPEASTARFFDSVAPLADKLGPILFQLPPHWRINTERLETFLDALPPKGRYAFEFRDESWISDETCSILSRHNAAVCIFDLEGRQTPFDVKAEFAYVRLHGPDGAYRGNYGEAALTDWAARIAEWRDSGLDCHCYFDNDEAGFAFANAVRLRQLLATP